MNTENLLCAIGLLGLIFCIFYLARNNQVYRVRLGFIDDDSLYGSGAYTRLPAYDAMLFSPRYWHIWTKKQWIEVTK